jgi:hypothetical protein
MDGIWPDIYLSGRRLAGSGGCFVGVEVDADGMDSKSFDGPLFIYWVEDLQAVGAALWE